MRIIAGRHRGTKLDAPDGRTTRPTSDRTRESLFNILEGGRFGDLIRDGLIVDGFAGSGALGLEALSRGASLAVFFEQDQAALACLRRNIDRLKRARDTMIVAGDATHPPRASRGFADLILLDPPYNTDLGEKVVASLHVAGWVGDETLIVVEIGKKQKFDLPDGFELVEERKYGAAKLVFLMRETG